MEQELFPKRNEENLGNEENLFFFLPSWTLKYEHGYAPSWFRFIERGKEGGTQVTHNIVRKLWTFLERYHGYFTISIIWRFIDIAPPSF